MRNALQKVWEGWKRFGQFLGDMLGRVVLTVFYFTILLPFGLGVRFLSDRLNVKGHNEPKWLARATGDLTIKHTRRQA